METDWPSALVWNSSCDLRPSRNEPLARWAVRPLVSTRTRPSLSNSWITGSVSADVVSSHSQLSGLSSFNLMIGSAGSFEDVESGLTRLDEDVAVIIG